MDAEASSAPPPSELPPPSSELQATSASPARAMASRRIGRRLPHPLWRQCAVIGVRRRAPQDHRRFAARGTLRAAPRRAGPAEPRRSVPPANSSTRPLPNQQRLNVADASSALVDTPVSGDDLARAEEFARETFVLPGEDAAQALAEGAARRKALDAALAELDAGREEPSVEWRREFSLMLGLERLLSEEEPHLADGTLLSPHQVDALSGTLTALTAELQAGNGVSSNGRSAPPAELPSDEVEVEGDEEVDEEPLDWDPAEEAEEEAAAEAHTEDPGEGRRFWGALLKNGPDEPPAGGPVTVETYQWFVRNAGKVSDAYTIVICDEAHTALGEKTSASIRQWSGPVFVGMTATGALIARHVTDLFPTQTSRWRTSTRRASTACRASSTRRACATPTTSRRRSATSG